MKIYRYKILTMALILMLSMSVLAFAASNEDNQSTQSNNIQNKTVFLDTGGKTGHLKYYEQYYSLNESGQLVIEQTRIYFDSETNNSKMKFLLIRPLTKEGTMYPESQIKAIAILDNVTILNAWYSNELANLNTNQPVTKELQYPELFIGLITAIIVSLFIVIVIVIKRKK